MGSYYESNWDPVRALTQESEIFLRAKFGSCASHIFVVWFIAIHFPSLTMPAGNALSKGPSSDSNLQCPSWKLLQLWDWGLTNYFNVILTSLTNLLLASKRKVNRVYVKGQIKGQPGNPTWILTTPFLLALCQFSPLQFKW